MILNESAPSFERYVAESDGEFPLWQKKNTNALIDSISSERKKISLMASSMQPAQLIRTGIHPKFGELSVIGWLEFFLLHEAHHIFTIFQLVHNSETVNQQ